MSKRRKVRSMNSLVSIVIPVYGRFDFLQECLDALPEAAKLEESSINYEVHVVDNASPDKVEADLFYAQYKDDPIVRVQRNATNLGFPKACNSGARKGIAPLLFFLNSDVVMQPGSLVHLVRAMDEPTVGIAGMKLLFPPHVTNDPHRPAGKVQHVGLATKINASFIHIFIGWSADHPKVNAVRDAYAVTGAALMVRRSLWTKLGGFNEIYGLGTFEDVELCLSARKMGYNVIVETKSVGYHYTNATVLHYKMAYPIQQNQFIFMSRWRNELTWTEWWHY